VFRGGDCTVVNLTNRLFSDLMIGGRTIEKSTCYHRVPHGLPAFHRPAHEKKVVVYVQEDDEKVRSIKGLFWSMTRC